jgi:hypothetical protein
MAKSACLLELRRSFALSLNTEPQTVSESYSPMSLKVYCKLSNLSDNTKGLSI